MENKILEGHEEVRNINGSEEIDKIIKIRQDRIRQK
jgi:hypothetical protein